MAIDELAEYYHHPHVRRELTCVLCQGDKDEGLVVCWPCWQKLKAGNPDAERIIAERERILLGAWRLQ
jgi:hypothetical protein